MGAETALSVLPHQGPREQPRPRPRPLSINDRDRVLCAIGLLEDTHMSIHASEGNTVERAALCRILEKLYNMLPVGAEPVTESEP